MLIRTLSALFLLVLLLLGSATGDVTNWAPWVSLKAPRTNAQAHVISHFAFIVGGTNQAYAFHNISVSEGRLSAAPDGIGSVPVIVWVDFNLVFQWTELELVGGRGSLVPLSAKSGSVATTSSIYISYACDILVPESNAFVEVVLPDPVSLISPNPTPAHPRRSTVEPVVVRTLSPSLVMRNAAALGAIRFIQPPLPSPILQSDSTLDFLPSIGVTVYLFGGRTAASVPVPEVEMFFNGTWTVVASMDAKSAFWTCNCAASQLGPVGSQYIALTGCLHCVTGEAAHETIVFDTSSNTFLHTQYHPQNYSNPNYLPSNNGGGMDALLMQFMPTIYEVPGPVGPVINLYDTLMQQENEIVTVDIQQRRTDCAQFNSIGFVFCVGGTDYPGGSMALPYADATQVHPGPEVSFDHVDGVYAPGDDVIVFAGLTCGSDTATFKLSTDPYCMVDVPMVPRISCAASAKFPTSQTITLRPGESLDTYLCYTEGSCSVHPNDRIPCGGDNYTTLTNDDCRWFPCCWDNVAQQCYAFAAPTPNNDDTTYWTNAIQSPLEFYRPPTPAPSPTHWYETTAFYASAGVGSAVIVYFVLALFWKSRVQAEVQTRQSLQSSLFTAFGKNYNVLGQIGQGSFGTVFLAERTSDGKRVALKVLPCNDSKQRNLALSEYDVLYNLKHENLIRVLDLILNWDTATAERSGSELHRRSVSSKSPSAAAANARRKRRVQEASSPAASASPASESSRLVQAVSSSINNDDSQRIGMYHSSEQHTSASTPHRPRNASNESAEELTKGPLVQPLLPAQYASDSASDRDESSPQRDVRAYGSFAEAVNFSSAVEIERRDLDFIAACPRFICIVTDYYPDGDLRDFVLNFGQQRPSSHSITASSSLGSKPQTSNLSGGSLPSSSGGAPAVIPERLVRFFGFQLCSLLQYMHNRKNPVIHRDLKPENVLMDGERLVVTDFGLAGVQDRQDYATTRAGTLFFTPPEALLRQHKASPAVDMWAVGCLLYAVCTRRVLPETARIMFSDVDDEDFEESIRDDLKAYSTGIQDAILGMLVKDPQRRTTSDQGVQIFERLMREAIPRSASFQ